MSASEAEADFTERGLARVKRRPRSAVTSGRKLFVAGDPNSAWSRRYHDLFVSHVDDVSAGAGADALSEAQLSLIRRAAALECELEQMDGRLSQGEEIDLDAYGRATSHLRRLHETLGLERRQRDVLTLGDLIRADQEAERERLGREQDAMQEAQP
jgi:hypothetical protein